jgi:3'-phosphoadenosine 5'-phosphosulfate sulfotransferase (PAPS reductase)/FAD synthetase
MEWDQMIGIRSDEGRRVTKIRARGHSTETTKETMRMPLADAGYSVHDVNEFWSKQPFNLELDTFNGRTLAGNCVLCFLKPAAQIQSLIREDPSRGVWWAKMELTSLASKPSGAVFRSDRPSYQKMMDFSRDQTDMFDVNEEGIACFCGD